MDEDWKRESEVGHTRTGSCFSVQRFWGECFISVATNIPVNPCYTYANKLSKME